MTTILNFRSCHQVYVSLQMCRPTKFVNEKQCWISGWQFAIFLVIITIDVAILLTSTVPSM